MRNKHEIKARAKEKNSSSSKLMLWFCVFFAISFIVNANQTIKTIPINPVNGTDTDIYEFEPDQNYGSVPVLDYIAGQGDANDKIFKGLINLSFICNDTVVNQDENITKIIHGFYTIYYEGVDVVTLPQIEIYPVFTSWGEHTVNWSNFNNGGVAGTDYNHTWNIALEWTDFPLDTQAGWVNVTLDPVYFNKECDGQNGDVQDLGLYWQCKACEDLNDGANWYQEYRYYTSDNGDTSLRPFIYVEVGEVPPPVPVNFSGTMDLTECPDTVSKSLNLWLIVIIALVFFSVSIFSKVYFIGFFASIFLFISSWFLVACHGIYAFILGVFSILALFWFVFKSFDKSPS